MPTPKPISRAERAVLNYRLYVELGLPIHLANARLLLRMVPRPLTDRVLAFMMPKVLEHMMSRLALETHEAWGLVDRVSRRHGLDRLVKDADYENLDRIRHKIIAHRHGAQVETQEHLLWFMATFQSTDEILGLVERVAGRTAGRVSDMQGQRLLPPGFEAALIVADALTPQEVEGFVRKVEGNSSV